MRLSFILLIFLLLFNGWAELLQQLGVDEHLGISAETGNPEELQQAQSAARSIQTGETIQGTLLGFYNALLNTVQGIVTGLQPGVQMLVNILPPGAAEDLVVWAFAVLPIIIAGDVLAYARGVDI
jgi:hypothetical protein